MPNAKKLPALEDGWAYVDFSVAKSETADRPEGRYYTANVSGIGEVFALEGPVWIPMPITEDAQREALEGYSATFETPDGSVTLNGLAAILAKKGYAHLTEQARGHERKLAVAGDWNAEESRARLLNWKYGTRYARSARKVTASQSKIDEIAAIEDPQERAARFAEYFQAIGGNVTA